MIEIKNVMKRYIFDSPTSVAEYIIGMIKENTPLTDGKILMNTIIDFIFTTAVTSTLPIIMIATIQTYAENPVRCIIQCLLLLFMLAFLLKVISISYSIIKILKNKK